MSGIPPVAETGSFTATGNSNEFGANGPFNVFIGGPFTGTVVLERLAAGAAGALVGWVPVSIDMTNNFSATAPGSWRVDEFGEGVRYRLRCSAYTSGTINYAMQF